jgi:hypothetical protein
VPLLLVLLLVELVLLLLYMLLVMLTEELPRNAALYRPAAGRTKPGTICCWLARPALRTCSAVWLVCRCACAALAGQALLLLRHLLLLREVR